MTNDKQLQIRVSNVCETNSESYGIFREWEFGMRGVDKYRYFLQSRKRFIGVP